MTARFGVGKDETGYYAWWGTVEHRRETLRTLIEAKAQLWLHRGCCHGSKHHTETCANCDMIGIVEFEPKTCATNENPTS